jgi:branched-chain amino acid transport system permease protein
MGIPRPDLGFFRILNAAQIYWVIVAIAILTTWITQRLGGSRIGRGWAYAHQDEAAAEAIGIDAVRMKLLAFALGAANAGVPGAFFATKITMVAPENFTWWESLIVLIIVVLGGMGSIPGVVLGSVVIVAMPELLRDFADYRMLILGRSLVLLALVRTQGTAPAGPNRAAIAAVAEPRALVMTAQALRDTIPAAAGPLLCVAGVTQRFAGVTALADVDLEFCPSEIFSLIGPNRAGKTTSLNVMTGVSPPTAGTARFAGRTISPRPTRIVALGISRTFQNIRLFGDLSVIENVAAGWHCRTRSGPLASVLRLPARRGEEAQIWACSLVILSQVGLRDRAEAAGVR